MTIALYPGSFNPFHKGHYDILLKAEKIFNIVVVARGVNPDKQKSEFELPELITSSFPVIEYNGLLTNCIEDYKKRADFDNITVIRGLRNSTDLQYEMTQYRYLQDLMPEIQVVSIFCNKEYEHISSSGIRSLSKYGADKVKDYLIE